MAQQNLDFNIVAHTKGMEAIATLINRVGSLEAETKRLASANQQLSASTDTVIRNGVRYNNAMDAQSRQLRQNRQGTQQLGMQINDFATSVSSGSSVTQAFTQQLGQVGIAMSQMGGAAGRIGAFLAGPWGALVLGATMALSMLSEKFITTGKSAKELEQIEADLVQGNIDILEARAALDKALGRNSNSYLKAKVAALEAANAEVESAVKASNAAQSRMQTAAKEAQFLDRLQKRMAATGGQYGGALGYIMKRGAQATGYGDLEGAVNEANAATVSLQKSTAKLINATAGVRNALKGDSGKGGSAGSGAKKEDTKNFANVNFLERDAAFLKASLDKGAKYWADYYNNIELTSVAVLKQIADDHEMVTATIQTVGETAGPAFLERFQEVQTAFQSIGNSVAGAFQGMLTGAMSWKDGMKGIIQSVINELWRLFVVQQIVGFVTKTLTGGVYGSAGTAARLAGDVSSTMAANPSLFANGTVNAPGGMAIVGERGPELVNLPRGSQVIPAHRAQSMIGGGVTVNVDARGSADPAAVRAQVQAGIMQAAPAIIAAAEARTVAGLRRPRLGGVMQ